MIFATAGIKNIPATPAKFTAATLSPISSSLGLITPEEAAIALEPQTAFPIPRSSPCLNEKRKIFPSIKLSPITNNI